jgi:hypothetical protein
MAPPSIAHILPYEGVIDGNKNEETVKPWDGAWIDPDSVTRLIRIPFPKPPSTFITKDPQHSPAGPNSVGEPSLSATLRDNVWLNEVRAKAPIAIKKLLQSAANNLSKWESTGINSQSEVVNGRISGVELSRVIKVTGASLLKEVISNEVDNIITILTAIDSSARKEMEKFTILTAATLGKVKVINRLIDEMHKVDVQAVVREVNNRLLKAIDHIPISSIQDDMREFVDKMNGFNDSLQDALLDLPREFVVSDKVKKALDKALKPITRTKEDLARFVEPFTEFERNYPITLLPDTQSV